MHAWLGNFPICLVQSHGGGGVGVDEVGDDEVGDDEVGVWEMVRTLGRWVGDDRDVEW